MNNNNNYQYMLGAAGMNGQNTNRPTGANTSNNGTTIPNISMYTPMTMANLNSLAGLAAFGQYPFLGGQPQQIVLPQLSGNANFMNALNMNAMNLNALGALNALNPGMFFTQNPGFTQGFNFNNLAQQQFMANVNAINASNAAAAAAAQQNQAKNLSAQQDSKIKKEINKNSSTTATASSSDKAEVSVKQEHQQQHNEATKTQQSDSKNAQETVKSETNPQTKENAPSKNTINANLLLPGGKTLAPIVTSSISKSHNHIMSNKQNSGTSTAATTTFSAGKEPATAQTIVPALNLDIQQQLLLAQQQNQIQAAGSIVSPKSATTPKPNLTLFNSAQKQLPKNIIPKKEIVTLESFTTLLAKTRNLFNNFIKKCDKNEIEKKYQQFNAHLDSFDAVKLASLAQEGLLEKEAEKMKSFETFIQRLYDEKNKIQNKQNPETSTVQTPSNQQQQTTSSSKKDKTFFSFISDENAENFFRVSNLVKKEEKARETDQENENKNSSPFLTTKERKFFSAIRQPYESQKQNKKRKFFETEVANSTSNSTDSSPSTVNQSFSNEETPNISNQSQASNLNQSQFHDHQQQQTTQQQNKRKRVVISSVQTLTVRPPESATTKKTENEKKTTEKPPINQPFYQAADKKWFENHEQCMKSINYLKQMKNIPENQIEPIVQDQDDSEQKYLVKIWEDPNYSTITFNSSGNSSYFYRQIYPNPNPDSSVGVTKEHQADKESTSSSDSKFKHFRLKFPSKVHEKFKGMEETLRSNIQQLKNQSFSFSNFLEDVRHSIVTYLQKNGNHVIIQQESNSKENEKKTKIEMEFHPKISVYQNNDLEYLLLIVEFECYFSTISAEGQQQPLPQDKRNDIFNFKYPSLVVKFSAGKIGNVTLCEAALVLCNHLDFCKQFVTNFHDYQRQVPKSGETFISIFEKYVQSIINSVKEKF